MYCCFRVFELEVALIPNTGFEAQYQTQYYHNNPKLSDRSVYSRQTIQEKQSDLLNAYCQPLGAT